MNISSISLDALSRASQQTTEAAEGIRRATSVDAETSPAEDQADFSAEAVKLLAARTAFKAAIELAKTADELNKKTIDLLA